MNDELIDHLLVQSQQAKQEHIATVAKVLEHLDDFDLNHGDQIIDSGALLQSIIWLQLRGFDFRAMHSELEAIKDRR